MGRLHRCAERNQMGGIFMGIMQDKRRVIEIPLDDIYPNPAQPRRSFPEKELLELEPEHPAERPAATFKRAPDQKRL